MSCLVLDFELAKKDAIRGLGVLIVGNVQGCSFSLPRNQQIKYPFFVEQWKFGLQGAPKFSFVINEGCVFCKKDRKKQVFENLTDKQ